MSGAYNPAVNYGNGARWLAGTGPWRGDWLWSDSSCGGHDGRRLNEVCGGWGGLPARRGFGRGRGGCVLMGVLF